MLCMLAVVRLNDCPPTVNTVMAAPFKMMEIPGSVNFLDDRVAVASFVWRFNEIPIHVYLSFYSSEL